MTQVNFYTLSSDDLSSRLQFACRLAEKAAALGHKILIEVDKPELAQQLDDLLWQFKPASFVVHTRDASATETQVLISSGETPDTEHDVLINLSDRACQNPQRFNRINEILSTEPAVLEAGRIAYRFYQSQGLQPETHKL